MIWVRGVEYGTAARWRVVRYGLRHKTTVREFRYRWTAAVYRLLKFWPVLDMYEVERR